MIYFNFCFLFTSNSFCLLYSFYLFSLSAYDPIHNEISCCHCILLSISASNLRVHQFECVPSPSLVYPVPDRMPRHSSSSLNGRMYSALFTGIHDSLCYTLFTTDCHGGCRLCVRRQPKIKPQCFICFMVKLHAMKIPFLRGVCVSMSVNLPWLHFISLPLLSCAVPHFHIYFLSLHISSAWLKKSLIPFLILISAFSFSLCLRLSYSLSFSLLSCNMHVNADVSMCPMPGSWAIETLCFV